MIGALILLFSVSAQAQAPAPKAVGSVVRSKEWIVRRGAKREEEFIGNVRYELSKTSAKPNEQITLTVFDWSTEYFQIKVGRNSSVMGFGRNI